MSSTYDVAIVGGGPAGSTCARALVARGARVVVLDRAEFPRVKLCAGWLSAGFWDAVGVAPQEYPHGLWPWSVCHVHYRGRDHEIRGKGWFIRRYELDEFLLRRSGAELRLGVHVKQFHREGDDGDWTVELPEGETIRARYLVGAGGTNCPVARRLAPERPHRALGVQELELQADPTAIERTRRGRDGEPELFLFDNVGGYGWNVPKSDWINVGCGTLDATVVRDAWVTTREHFRSVGHVPPDVDRALDDMKGHSYYLFEPRHLAGAARDNALLVGDSLGLAHPITGEGILPAVVSGAVAAEAILAKDGASYPERLARHPVIADYARVHRIVEVVRRIRRRRAAASDAAAQAPSPSPSPSRMGTRLLAHGFGWMFSGAKLPMPRVLDRVLDLVPGGV